MGSWSVVGLARSGVAAANALVRRGERVLASDLRRDVDLSRLDPAVEVALGENRLRAGDTVVVSPGLRPGLPVFREAAERGLEVIGEIGLFQRLEPDAPILAVTGTDGKSTTTTWLGHMVAEAGLPVWVGGNLGTPLCEAVDGLVDGAVVVAEVSCFQLWTSPAFHPRVAVATNIAEDHLDYFAGSFDRYVAAKRALLAHLGPGDAAVLNREDPVLATWRAPRVLWYGVSGGDLRVEDGVLCAGDRLLAPVDALPLPGRHNVENALAAAGGALAFGIDVEAVERGLRTYQGLPHRVERIRTLDGVTWYNDSKATNPHASEAALRSFQAPFVLICGGSEKGSDFDAWASLVVERCHHVVCIGETAPRIVAALRDRVPVETVDGLSSAIAAARRAARAPGVVVLSPACASYDQFQSFEDRGDQMRAMVLSLA